MPTNCASVPKSILLVATIAVWSELYLIEAEVYPSIYWTPHNPIFSNSRNELKVFLDNSIHIVCPNPSTVMSTLKDPMSIDNLYENLWKVDEASYKTCSVRTAVRRKSVLVCDKPSKLHYVTIVFKTIQSGSTEKVFEPGKEYFFIATSDGTEKSLNSTSGGHCSTHNMKFKVYICRGKEDARCNHIQEYNTQKTTTPANEDSVFPPSTSASLSESNRMTRKTPANEDSVFSPSTSASLNESNHRNFAVSNFCNNSAIGSNKGDADHSVWPIAILTSVAVLSIGLNAVLLRQRIRGRQNIRRDSTQLSIKMPS